MLPRYGSIVRYWQVSLACVNSEQETSRLSLFPRRILAGDFPNDILSFFFAYCWPLI
jgi:hypothetical protein